MHITTERLIIRDFVASDASSVLEFLGDEEIARTSGVYTIENIEDALDYVSNASLRGEYGIALKETDEIIGSVSFYVCPNPLYIHFDNSCEIGYMIARRFWGHGYASEALKSFVDHLFNELHVDVVTGHCDYDNLASAKVMLNAGFISDGIPPFDEILPNGLPGQDPRLLPD